jgi:DNA repair protein RadD
MLQLYPYQRAAVDSVNTFFSTTGGNPLCVVPTGGGKSLIIGTFIKEALEQWPGTRIVILAHVPELIVQNYAELIEFWPNAPAGIYSAKLGKRQMHAQIVFAGIQSIHRKGYNLQKVDIVLVDEAHLIPRTSNTMYRRFLGDLLQINPLMKVAGFTATPYRMDSGMLHQGKDAIFDDVCFDVGVKELIESGYLSPLNSRPARVQIDTSNVAMSGFDFNALQLEAAAKHPDVVAQIADEIMANAAGRQGILVFGSGKDHCTMLRDAMRERGVSTEMVFGDTPTAERNSIVANFKARRIRCLVSLRVFTTGFNAKHVDLLALVNATKSTGLYVQIVGRGTRLFPGKTDCLVLDFGGNIARHGPIDDLIVKKEKKPKDGDGTAPMKPCPSCGMNCPASVRQCIGCGFEFPEAQTLINTQAAALDILSDRNDLAPAWLDVTGVHYHRHTKVGSPYSLRVTYSCGLVQHREWICFEHGGGIKSKAHAWWRRRTNITVPETVSDALLNAKEIDKPAQIAVRPSGNFTEIVGYRGFSRDIKKDAA